MRKILLVLINLCFFHMSVASAAPLEGFADIVEPLMPAVVNINTVKYAKKKQQRSMVLKDPMNFEQLHDLLDQFGMPFFMDEMPTNPKATSLGSGFITDPEGYVVTNYHVIKDADEINVKLNDNREFVAKIVGSDQKTDIAVLKIDSKTPFPFVRFGDSSVSRVGDWIIAIGNPFGLGGTVTSGIISSKSRDIDIIYGGVIDDYIQTDAAINGGNSGGPMFNMHGEVIGVNTAILSSSGTNIGISFAIPSSSVTKIVKQLKDTGKIERGKLGIRIQELTPEIADGLSIKDARGALIAEVEKGSSAEKAGIKSRDIIVEYNGQEIKNVKRLQVLVAETSINQEVKIKVLRDGKEIELKAIIKQTQEKDLKSADASDDDLNKGYEVINGVKFADIMDDSTNEGVVVISNEANNSWRNLVVGDVITAVNQIAISKLDDFKKEYENSKKLNKKNIVFLINRGKMTVFLALPLE